jgi:hypothetical protein
VLAPSLLCLVLVALLAYREWGAARDRHEAAAERLAMAEERREAATERRELYQRIQAPEIAVAEAHREARGPHRPRKPIAADDDARFAERDKVAQGG